MSVLSYCIIHLEFHQFDIQPEPSVFGAQHNSRAFEEVDERESIRSEEYLPKVKHAHVDHSFHEILFLCQLHKDQINSEIRSDLCTYFLHGIIETKLVLE